MDDQIPQRTLRAKELLHKVRHAAMATVNADGSPHNTPFFFLYSLELSKIFWGSHPESIHSQNILRSGQIFIVVYDAVERGGLYIQAEGGHIVEGIELDEALEIHNDFRAREKKEALDKSLYEHNSPQRMWSAKITRLWIPVVERDNTGHVIKDYRHEITVEDLK